MLKNKKIYLMVLIGLFIVSLLGCSKNVEKVNKNQSQLAGYPIANDVLTTLDRTVVPDEIPADSEKIFPYEISKYKENGYGIWHYGPGVPSIKRLDIMPATYSGESVTNTARLLNFFTISDVHITDKESPAQAIYFGYKGGPGLTSAYSPGMLYSTQILDAAVQTINVLNKKNPFDFGISLGDVTNSAQYNELRWFIDVLDGKDINPDSGIKDDPIPGPSNDYQDKFKAAGLDKTIPWYQALGNHDRFWMGTIPPNDNIRQAIIGKNILNIGDIFHDPNALNNLDFYMGAIDGRTPNGDIIGVGATKDFVSQPEVPAADPNRHFLSTKEWMSEFLKTDSKPMGHGFTKTNIDEDFASYSFEPNSKLPIKVIVLDDTQNENEPSSRSYGRGSLDKLRYDWLVSELDKGQAEGKLMIIAAHVPLQAQEAGSPLAAFMAWNTNAYIPEKNLISKLNEYPNLLMWVAGHRHFNTVKAFKSPDENHPELGFWQVETSSLKDFCQQFRTFEIVRNSDNTISIFTTNIDPAVKDGSLAAMSRSYVVATQHFYKIQPGSMPSGAYNAELVKQLSPEMQVKMKNYGATISK